MGDTFANTVQKARRFAATIDVPKSRKSVRISTPSSHEVVQLIQEDTSLNKRMENIEKIIKLFRSLRRRIKMHSLLVFQINLSVSSNPLETLVQFRLKI